MALTKCKECGSEISDKAAACPKCGAPVPAPRKKTGLLTWLVVGFLGLTLLGTIISNSSSNSTGNAAATAASAKPPPTAAEKLVESDRYAAAALVLMLKKSAKDPDSFKLHTAMVTKDGAGCVEYSATNSFNARIRGIAAVARGKTDVSDSSASWNKLCAHKENTDYTDLFKSTILQPD
jgi:zinc-ribbon domain